MTNIIQARNFLQLLKTNDVYAVIGKNSPWDELDNIQITTEESDLNDAIFAKKFLPVGFSLAIRNIPWDEVVFDEYNGLPDSQEDDSFYCVTSESNIYKCLSNNGGSVSTEQPSLVTPESFETSDGYVWKYIASVPEPVSILFNNSGYIPIKNVTSPESGYEMQYASQSSAISGTIDRIDVIQSGKKYSQSVGVYIAGDGTGAKATANVHSITGEIQSITVTNKGTGYTYAQVTVIDPSNIGGAGAILNAIVSPLSGHGSSPEDELFARYVISSLLVEGTESGYIKGDISFRKLSLITDFKERELGNITITPNDYLLFRNTNNPFQFIIETKYDIDSMSIKINDVVFNVITDPSDPYNGNESQFDEAGVSVWYSATNNGWKFDLGSTLSNVVYNSELLASYAFYKNDVSVFGDINNPTEENTINFKFAHYPSVINDEEFKERTTGSMFGSIYDLTTQLEVNSISGDFEMNETIGFVSGGNATLTYIADDKFHVSSPKNVYTGDIVGVNSGATATVTKIDNDKKYTASFLKRYAFDVKVKSEGDNLRISPVFKF